eukprot:CAMPEP_0197625520 /NCGR_PEP_ID=MMETSP1338-20131121/4863_1 /TAXON_ID=43686 ORGANISM="Pelagodinium beii, Strain RCC1491" /NCGR_SAMPLE_ID=MMETSP1338 /ASSEMBLY_ACC=CAM_ASM_000754 /LENGTH=42 /DNA_ID= /DNA_START= /DNA_END= /DNA_ORIENTATION=
MSRFTDQPPDLPARALQVEPSQQRCKRPADAEAQDDPSTEAA